MQPRGEGAHRAGWVAGWQQRSLCAGRRAKLGAAGFPSEVQKAVNRCSPHRSNTPRAGPEGGWRCSWRRSKSSCTPQSHGLRIGVSHQETRCFLSVLFSMRPGRLSLPPAGTGLGARQRLLGPWRGPPCLCDAPAADAHCGCCSAGWMSTMGTVTERDSMVPTQVDAAARRMAMVQCEQQRRGRQHRQLE
jgi:hypothetical protein